MEPVSGPARADGPAGAHGLVAKLKLGRVGSRGRVNVVFSSADHLRALENEFSQGIGAQLPGWTSTTTERLIDPACVNVTFYITRRAHIMMSHGVADKSYLVRKDPQGGLELNKYRMLAVPGPWMKRKLLADKRVELAEDNIRCVGWPRLDTLLAAQAQLPARPRGERIRVLWAPTHAGASRPDQHMSSYPALEEHVDALSRLFDFETSLHPDNRDKARPTFEKLLDADVIISDRGTLVYEAWALGKPVVFPRWILRDNIQVRTRHSAEAVIFRENIGLHAATFDEMVDMIRAASAPGPDVTDFMADYLPRELWGHSYELIADAVRDVWSSGDLSVGQKVSQPV